MTLKDKLTSFRSYNLCYKMSIPILSIVTRELPFELCYLDSWHSDDEVQPQKKEAWHFKECGCSYTKGYEFYKFETFTISCFL